MSWLRNVGRNLRPDNLARRGTYPTYLPYYDYPTPAQGYYPQPSPYPFTPAYPQTPYVYPSLPQGHPQPRPYPITPVYPHNPYPSRYQHPQTFSSTDAQGQLPVFNSGPRVPVWSNTEAQQPSDVLDVQLHHELCWNRYWTGFSLGIIWDVTLPPYAARLSTPRLTIIQPNPAASAITTQRRFNRIELLTDNPYLAYYMRSWGPISVSETSPTILQLLQAIYEYLETPFTDEDYRCVSSNPQNVDRLNVSRESRVRDGFDAVYAAAIQGPFRRSDVIGGHRRFLGIRVVKLQDGILTLHFNLGPGPVPSFY